MKKILITGGCGTIGTGLLEYFIKKKKIEIYCLDNNENKIFEYGIKYKNQNVHFLYGDVKSYDSILRHTNNKDIIFHTAAMKHVSICETFPNETIDNNVMGISNIIKASIKSRVKKVIFTSSDKAVNPTNVMGTSKLLCEKLITAANNYQTSTIFSSVRFGNVLGSAGSVLPIIVNQLNHNLKLTLTHKDMTRFVMTIDQAINLLIEASNRAIGGEVFVFKMPVLNIHDLFLAVIQIHCKTNNYKFKSNPINLIGAKPGEKMFEELMTDSEVKTSRELKNFFVVLPAFDGFYKNLKKKYYNLKTISKPFISKNTKPLSIKEIKNFLIKNKLIEDINKSDLILLNRQWPGDN